MVAAATDHPSPVTRATSLPRGAPVAAAPIAPPRRPPSLLPLTIAGALPILLILCLGTASSPLAPGERADLIATTVRSQQWALDVLDAKAAWRTGKGAGAVVAILDTGVDPRHPDLADAVIAGPDFTGVRPGLNRPGRHGTAMASLIAGRGHGPGQRRGVLGIAPEATILSIQVTLDDPAAARGENTHALAEGIRYAADHDADVISMSLGAGGGRARSAAEEEAVRYALERGAVLVASAGNDGHTGNRRNFPAAYPGVIAVGAVDESLTVTPFSNRQPYLSVVAPGTRVVSADGDGSYIVSDGTSSAAALVAGVAALIKAEHPRLPPSRVRQAIEQGAVRPRHHHGTAHDPAYGHGVVNAARALHRAACLARAETVRTVPACTGVPRTAYEESRHLVCCVLAMLAAVMSARVMSARRTSVRLINRHGPGSGKGMLKRWSSTCRDGAAKRPRNRPRA